MKISVIDEGKGIISQLAPAIGAVVEGRFVYIPKEKGGGYITGFSFGSDMRMMIRNYHLHEQLLVERTNKLLDGQDDIVVQLSGILPSVQGKHSSEQPHVMICKHALTAIMEMPSNTVFSSVTIAVARSYLMRLFGHLTHPVVRSILELGDNFVFETGISPEMIRVGSEITISPVPVSLENHFYQLKCEELLCYTFALLMEREALPATTTHIDDIKAIYLVKQRLTERLSLAPNIAVLAAEANMSEPKLRKLFKQTFGKGVFEYYQSLRMEQAAQLLREKKMNVSQVGYAMGFSNLSHFSRVFESHHGVKPKKFSLI